jgi:DNA polymerase I
MLKIFKKQNIEEKEDPIKDSLQGILLNSYYKDDKLFCVIKTKEGKKRYVVDFSPYFYLTTTGLLSEENKTEIKEKLFLKDLFLDSKENHEFCYRCVFYKVSDLIEIRNKLMNLEINFSYNYKLYEYDIPFIYRFFLEKKISNFREVSFILNKDNKIIDIKDLGKIDLKDLSTGCFDIEVLVSNTLAFPTPGKDPIISISYLDSKYNRSVFFLSEKELSDAKIQEYKKDLELKDFYNYTNEFDLINGFLDFVKKKDPDIIYTYNGVFDFEYLQKAYNSHTQKDFIFVNSPLIFTKRPSKRVTLENIVHMDVYIILKQLNYLQVFNQPKLDLNTIYTKLTNNSKKELPPKKMREAYLNKEYKKIIEYNLDDVLATQHLAENYQNLVIEMANYLNAPVLDILNSAAGSLVEKQFIKYYFEHNLLVPNKPSQQEIIERNKYSFTGGYVKQPISGIHNNIAVLDFRSYHISILMSYNISPETINCSCCKNIDLSLKTSVLGNYICKKKKGFVPIIVDQLLTQRMKNKDLMNTFSKDSKEYSSLYAKQYAQKILLASTYGYMGFSGSRWYSRQVLDIMFFLVRSKIQEVITDFENLGYLVLYGDTDSCFIQFTNLDKLQKDLYNISLNLPKDMHLELEEVYMSGIFVKSRDKEKAAKKKYALLDFNENLKIKGFEYVRRDWCILVKETQKEILKLILKEQDPKKAVIFIQNVISDLEQKEVPISKLVIQTFLRKSISSYKTKNPVMSAVISAKKLGAKIKTGQLIEYVITEKGATISEKAKLFEFVKEKEYDSNYYINNQLLPAILPILDEFNVTKEELLTSTKQKGIGEFF